MGAGREGERGTVCEADATTHSRTMVAYRWLWQYVLTLSQNTQVVWWWWCGGRSEEEGGKGRKRPVP